MSLFHLVGRCFEKIGRSPIGGLFARRRRDADDDHAVDSDSVRLSAVWLIYAREMRDQLRDRRTLFTIAVLPMLLYPLVGTLLLQIAQFTQGQDTSVCIVGTENLDGAPELIRDEKFLSELTNDPSADRWRTTLYTWSELAGDRDAVGDVDAVGNLDAVGAGSLDTENNESENNDFENVVDPVRSWIRYGTYDVAVVIPPNFIADASSDGPSTRLQVFYNVASDQSTVAYGRVEAILSKWRSSWVQDRLKNAGIDLERLQPFEWDGVDTAPPQTRQAALWSKLLPFIMLVWAMTGAFYPAIDLVAGEKERGTLETILCSPALRGEIVWGKLATVTTFSIMTAVLNAASMMVTSSFVLGQIGIAGTSLGSPPMIPMLWLFVALVPLSALFSALALAVAAMARSSKEGQYYLMPLMMLTLPLVMLPMLPGTTLTVGTGLIPVTGMFLLVRALVEGQYGLALFHLPLVMVVTGVCLHLAVTWARRQFENESVLFGGGDQWELGKWMKHLWRDRQTAATAPQAYACGAIILVALFFGKLAHLGLPDTLSKIAVMVLLPQIGLILAPVLLMAIVLTTSMRRALRIRMPHWTTLPLAVLLGLTLHPSYVLLAEFVKHVYPISSEALSSMKPFVEQLNSAPILAVIFLMAVVPAVCEELAFRGFIFGGLARGGGRFRAVIVTSVLFGFSHGVLQQSITATCMGILLGWVALRTGSVLPGILIHLTNNTLSVSLGRIAESDWGGKDMFVRAAGNDLNYQPLWIAISIPIAITIIIYFATLQPSDADDLADRIEVESDKLADPSAAWAAV